MRETFLSRVLKLKKLFLSQKVFNYVVSTRADLIGWFHYIFIFYSLHVCVVLCRIIKTVSYHWYNTLEYLPYSKIHCQSDDFFPKMLSQDSFYFFRWMRCNQYSPRGKFSVKNSQKNLEAAILSTTSVDNVENEKNCIRTWQTS